MKILRACAVLCAVMGLAGCGSSPAPAATVDGHAISMTQYTTEFHAERAQETSQLGYDVCSTPGLQPACTLVKKKSLNTLIDRVLIQEYASNHHIAVTPAESQRRWTQVFKNQFDNRKDVLQAWTKRTGQTEQFIRAGLDSDLLAQKVLYAVTAKTPATLPGVRLAHLVAASRKELSQAQLLLHRGAKFLVVVSYLRHISAHGCANPNYHCGEVGWTPDAFLPPSRPALKTASVGTVVGPYVQEQSGQKLWDMYLIEQRSAHYQLSAQQQYAYRTLLFQRWLQHEQARARVKRYVAI